MKKNMISLLFCLALTSIPLSGNAQRESNMNTVKEYFSQLLDNREAASIEGKNTFSALSSNTTVNRRLKAKDIRMYQEMVWEAWCETNKERKEEKIIELDDLKNGNKATWKLPANLEPNAVMPYFYGRKGDTRTSLPLFIYLHGSGPKALEWTTGLQLANMFDDAPSAYFIPQIPNEGEYYRWWHQSKQYAWEKLIRQTLVSGKVDANRLYIFGISEGGYGSQRLASFYADYWAAAGPMAGGEPLKNAPVENCANIGFSFLTGADDQGFYRNILTHYTQMAFDSAQLSSPLSCDGKPLFQHRINLLPGMQHSIDYRLTTPWMKAFTRNPYPKTVLWEDFEMDGRHRSGFYNIQVLARPSAARTYYEMHIADNVVTLNISDVEYITTQKDKQWGIDMRFRRQYTKTKGGILRIYLNDSLVRLNRKVTIIINGEQVFCGKITPNLKDMINSCAEFFDPYRIYPASVEVKY